MNVGKIDSLGLDPRKYDDSHTNRTSSRNPLTPNGFHIGVAYEIFPQTLLR